MVNIHAFIDRVGSMDARNGRELVMTVAEARALRDEIAHLLAQRLEQAAQPQPIKLEVHGGRW
jgi:hypothetical protein